MASKPGVELKASTLRVSKDLTTWKERRERNIVMQGFDYSCGAAAMATLLTYYFGDPVTEREILLDILENLQDSQFEERKKEGLSLFDLKQYAERRGYQALGVRLEPSALPQLGGPVLVYVEPKGFEHFAVLRGVREDRVFLADPSRGNVRVAIDEFAETWPGIALVLGREAIDIPHDYPLAIERDETDRQELEAARRSIYLGL